METKQENIIRTDYAEEMQKSYIDYAMSVIVSRALPDVRDGLKPVQRRTLYDMYELGIRYDRPYRKCARIVGDTMGKYHPHGDSSIYEALVVMAQDFKKGCTLVDGHGNFGSIEGDGAAAMRYTEARLQKITQDVFLADLDKNVVDFLPNFDETEKEPSVLPVRIPNLLVNGADGIAVGMATSIPPHNLAEVVDAVKAYMKNPEISVKGLMRYMKGPDFPTGGIIVNKDDLPAIYETGTGKIRVRGRVETEKLPGGRQQLVVTQIPYPMLGANIGKFLNDAASLVETRKTTDIVDISNQSSKEGIRIVIELRKGADPEALKNLLYKKTRLEDTFGVNMLAVADGRPETLSLRQIIEHHVDFLFEISNRKYRNLLAKEQEKQEIQEGLIQACDVIDLIIEILRGSQSREQAMKCLSEGVTEGIRFRTKTSQKQAAKLHFTEKQAAAILDMRLHRLIGLELTALIQEHEQTLANIARYEELLNNYDEMAGLLIKELDAVKREFGVARKTSIENAEEAVFEETPPEEIELCFLMDRFGYMKTIDMTAYERNKEAAEKENRFVFPVMSGGRIALFTDTGKMHTVRVKEIPSVRFRDKGIPADNVSNYDSSQERILFAADMAKLSESVLLFVSRDSMCKQVPGSEFETSRKTTQSTKLGEGDQLVYVGPCQEIEQLLLQTSSGCLLRFLMTEVSSMKKTSIGVRGMKLSKGDYVEKAFPLAGEAELTLSIDDREYPVSKVRLSRRDARGSRPKL